MEVRLGTADVETRSRHSCTSKQKKELVSIINIKKEPSRSQGRMRIENRKEQIDSKQN
jgi:hypothetical protein